ncbi:hypothetical protein MY11210_005618 [Beauveria gryllotalpidicola]
MPVGLLSLSTEVLTLIIAFAADASPDLARTSILCHLRLTCSRLSGSAAPALFRSLILRPCDPSIARFHALLDDPSPSGPRFLVRRVVFESEEERQVDCIFWGWSWDPEVTGFTEEWRAAVARLAELDNVQHVCVRFPPQCLDDDDLGTGRYMNFPDSDIMAQRRNTLVAVFEAIAGMRQPLRVLSVENLQNFVDTDFTNKSCFTKVITSIQELHVSIAAEIHEDNPANAPALPTIPRFWPSFASVWLAPASPRLSSLTLYCDIYFGAVPFWQGCSSSTASQDTAALAFPRLRSLALGRYALAYKSQLDDFLTSAAVFPELRRLTLDDCPILSHLSVPETD